MSPVYREDDKAMTVTLSHAQNPDIRSGEVRGYWTNPGDKGKAHSVPVDSLAHAAAVCRAYIMRRELGGGNWTGGTIKDAQGVVIGRVAYNGRVFAPAAPGFPDWQHGECLHEVA